MRKAFKKVLVVSAATACALALLPGPAHANDHNVSPLQCSENNEFKFNLFYNSGQGGSIAKFGYSEENFGANDGSAGHLVYTFCRGLGAGSGQQVKNNAGSAGNRTMNGSGCTARVHFNSYWKGIYDDIPNSTGRNLVNTYNENASFKWRGSGC